MSKSDGGPAFPRVEPQCGDIGARIYFGMTLRDYFMCHAPAAEIDEMTPQTLEKCAAYIGMTVKNYNGASHYKFVLAKARAEWADAMIAEREK